MSVFFALSPRLHVADFQRSLAFYRDVLGFDVETTFPDENPVFAMLSRDRVGIQIGGPAGKKDPSERSTVTLYFEVDDARAVHAALKDKVAVEWGPEVFFYQRREFAFRDPDGHLVIISEETDDPPTHVED